MNLMHIDGVSLRLPEGANRAIPEPANDVGDNVVQIHRFPFVALRVASCGYRHSGDVIFWWYTGGQLRKR